MENLIIDPEFRDKIPPLTEDEFSQLKENILSDRAVFSPLILWGNIILDGHNRYEIIQQHPGLTYAVHRLELANRYEALSWICKNQLGRRNLTPQQKKYLIGQRYEAERQAEAFHGNQYTLSGKSAGDKICHQQKEKTRKRIAAEIGMSQGYVQNANSFAKGVDAAEEALPGIRQEILTGAIKPTETEVAAVARAEPRKRPRLAAGLRKSRDDKKDQQAYHPSPLAAPRRVIMQKIAEISAEMERPKPRITEEQILSSMDGEVVSFMEICDNFFREYPTLLSNENYRRKVVQVLERLKHYIAEIEGGRTV